MYFSLSPLGKGWRHSIEQTWILFTQECFVPNLIEIGPVSLEKEKKMWKVYKKDNDNDKENRQIVIRKANLSLRFMWILNIQLFKY